MPAIDRQLTHVRPGDFGIIGDPVAHSLSPAMQNAALGGNRFHLFHVTAEELAAAVRRLRDVGIRGVNVTIPHKKDAAALVSRLEGFAREAAAVNTIRFGPEGAVGYNTDGPGFGRALTDDLKFDPRGKSALVLGAGGTGAVLVRQLVRMGAREILWWNRSADRLAEAKKNLPFLAIRAVTRLADVDMNGVELIVNATAVGLREGDGLPAGDLRITRGQVVLDTIYHRETEFVRAARRAGARGAGGLPMLLHQGALAFEIWTGAAAPVATMKAALIKTLEQKGQKVLWQFGI